MDETNEVAPRLPTNWQVKAVDVSANSMRAGFNLPPGWQPLQVVLRGTQPVLIMYIEVG
jgi:hypothetical protein